jgi:ribosomal protein L34E
MLINCNNKGCMKSSNALLDEETLEVICQECGKPIYGIAEAMKRTLKSFGQVVRTNERKAFTLACRNCRANREVVLDQDGNTICKVCHNEISVTAAFKMAMEATGTKLEKITVDRDVESTKKKDTKRKVTRKNSE